MSKAKEIRALQEELYLLAVGASGCAEVEDPANGTFVYHALGCEAWCQWIVAIERRFDIKKSAELHVTASWNLAKFESIDGAAEHLYEHGYRAGNARPQ